MILSGTDPRALAQATACLVRGELIGLPTETVYGLAARADDEAAVARIFAAKGRPRDHPLIVHVADISAAQRFAASWPPAAQRLASAFWPGPLTLIVPRRRELAQAAAAGQDSVGLRCPAHPVAQALLQLAQAQGVWGLAAPSANRFGRISPTSAAHVAAEFDAALLVLDGGACEVGIESSIVDCTHTPPVLLRPGVLSLAQIEAVLEQPLGQPNAQSPRVSGSLAAHYAPRALLRLMSAGQIITALEIMGETRPRKLAVYGRSVELAATVAASTGALWHHMPTDAAAAAHELFAVLRNFDAQGAQLIWVETPPELAPWAGVRDRLQRAAASF